MKLLLDTHILLWWMADSRKLGREAKHLIADPGNVIFVSVASLWELWLKESLGKLELGPEFEERLSAEEFEFLPILREHAREAARLPWIHRDPFDRMLIAQAKSLGLRLLSSDRISARYGDVVLKA